MSISLHANTEDKLTRVRRRLMAQARLFEDPQAYVAGVEDTLAAVRVEFGLGDDDRIVLDRDVTPRMI